MVNLSPLYLHCWWDHPSHTPFFIVSPQVQVAPTMFPFARTRIPGPRLAPYSLALFLFILLPHSFGPSYAGTNVTECVVASPTPPNCKPADNSQKQECYTHNAFGLPRQICNSVGYKVCLDAGFKHMQSGSLCCNTPDLRGTPAAPADCGQVQFCAIATTTQRQCELTRFLAPGESIYRWQLTGSDCKAYCF